MDINDINSCIAGYKDDAPRTISAYQVYRMINDSPDPDAPVFSVEEAEVSVRAAESVIAVTYKWRNSDNPEAKLLFKNLKRFEEEDCDTSKDGNEIFFLHISETPHYDNKTNNLCVVQAINPVTFMLGNSDTQHINNAITLVFTADSITAETLDMQHTVEEAEADVNFELSTNE